LGLTIYLDRRKIGEKQFWKINVANAQNVALEAECLKPKRYGSMCLPIVFTQADLE
jgi:serine/threonine-protein kinase